MSEDMLLHFSSNSSNQSNQSLPSKIAKVEARMAGKTSPSAPAPVTAQPTRPSVSSADKFGDNSVQHFTEPIVSRDSDDDDVGVAKVEQEAETSKSPDAEKMIETNSVEKFDNVVLRKLLRGPRYFDPPSSWGTCYNCGEEGHTAANCTSARHKKPCFLCGSVEHNVKKCEKRGDCFICESGGHSAIDCPEKAIGGSQNAKICLKCGDSEHDMFSCRNGYSPEDLKEIQCYICKCFGHLCCANNTGTGPREVSCNWCGRSGHTGLACARLRAATTNSCNRCGEQGHFARACASTYVKFEDKKKQKEVKIARLLKRSLSIIKSSKLNMESRAHLNQRSGAIG